MSEAKKDDRDFASIMAYTPASEEMLFGIKYRAFFNNKQRRQVVEFRKTASAHRIAEGLMVFGGDVLADIHGAQLPTAPTSMG